MPSRESIAMPTPIATVNSNSACRLIVNADDFGKSLTANQAIQQTATQGILTSTTVMANMPDAQGIVELHATCPAISIGLHVNLTLGRPILPCDAIPSLVENTGHFLSIGEFLRRAWIGDIKREHIRAEITAQLSWLIDRVGQVSHLDSHQHIHSRNLQVLQEVLQVGRAHSVRRIRSNRRFFVSSQKEPSSQMCLKLRHFSASPLFVLGLVLTFVQNLHLKRYGYISPQYILTPFPTITTGSTESAVQMWSRSLMRIPQKTFETIFHPGGGPQYEGQVEVLCHQNLKATIKDLAIQLVNYSEIS